MTILQTDGIPVLRIGALLRMAHEVAERTVSDAANAAGFDEPRPAHFRLMRYPGLEGVRPNELGARLGTSKQAINPLLNDLERWGYIQRRVHPGDERGRVIRLTKRGQKLMATIWGAHAELEANWEKRVGPRRFRVLWSALREIVQDHRVLVDEPRPTESGGNPTST